MADCPRSILYVNNSADVYGASRSLLRLLPRIRALGHSVRVVLPESGPLHRQLQELGIEVLVEPRLAIITRSALTLRRLPQLLLGFPRSVCRLYRLITGLRIQCVHTNTGVILSPAVAACLAGVPHVWHIRDSFAEFRSLWSVYARYILRFSRRVVCNSSATAAQFPPSEKVVVIYNGVDLAEHSPPPQASLEAFRRAFGLDHRPVIGCVGRIKFLRKGQETLVQALRLLKNRSIPARGMIVGAPAPGNEQHLANLHQLIHDLDLSDEVVLTGELDDPRPAYAAMDVLALPSGQSEPFGNVISEAMAMGLPVVATALGGALEQVVDGVTGFLVPPADPQALADKLAVLLQDPALRLAFGRAGYERLRQRFSLDQTVQQLVTLYESLPLPRGHQGRER